MTIQESPRTVRRKKYKINVQSADNENVPGNVLKIVPGYKINVQSADYENVPDNVPKTVPDSLPKTVPENVQKEGTRETGVKVLILKQRYHNSQLLNFI